MRDDYIRVYGNLIVEGTKGYIASVKCPLHQIGDPGNAVILDAIEFVCVILPIEPGESQPFYLVGSLLKNEVMVASNANDVLGRAVLQPLTEICVQPDKLKAQRVIEDRTNVPGNQEDIALWNLGQVSMEVRNG